MKYALNSIFILPNSALHPIKFQAPYEYSFICLRKEELSLNFVLCILLHLLKAVVGVSTVKSVRVRLEQMSASQRSHEQNFSFAG